MMGEGVMTGGMWAEEVEVTVDEETGVGVEGVEETEAGEVAVVEVEAGEVAVVEGAAKEIVTPTRWRNLVTVAVLL